MVALPADRPTLYQRTAGVWDGFPRGRVHPTCKNAIGLGLKTSLQSNELAPIDRVRNLALQIKHELNDLAESTGEDHQIAQGISGFLGESFMNLVRILWISSQTDTSTTLLHLYSISVVLTVPQAVPEPSSLLLGGVGMAIVLVQAGYRRRKAQRRQWPAGRPDECQ